MNEESILVDEYDTLQKSKKEIEMKIEELKERIISFSVENGRNAIFGTSKICSVKEFEKVVYPENKTELINIIKQKGLYENLSSINYFKLSPRILKGEIDKEIIALTRKEKYFRVAIKDKNVIAVS